MKRKALGKGLRSLIPEAPPRIAPAPVAGQPDRPGLQQLDIDRIHPNRGQPRDQFDQTALEQLARSLKKDGVLQPVIVRRYKDDEYELIAGERRWRAAQLAGLLKIPAIVREASDDQMLEIALVENLQREELNPIEEANAFQTLIDDLGLTQQEVAQRVGKQRATVANALRLLNLPRAIQDRIKQGQLSAGHAKALASLTDSAAQLRMADRIAKEGLSVRQSETIVSRMGSRSGGGAAVGRAPQRDPNVVAAEETLQRALGTKVRIVPAKKGGRVEVHYFTDDELDRVYQVLMSGSGRPS